MERELVQEGMSQYLKLPGSGEETIGDRMFSYQNIPGFLPVELTWVNGQKQYVYDISGKVPLESYLSDAGVGVDEMRHILSQILSLPEQLGKFLLDRNGAVIEANDLYVDPRSKELYAVYNPDTPHHGMTAIARLLEFIMGKMNQHNQDLVFFVYGLHRLALEEGTTCQILKMYMEKYQGRETKQQQELPIPDSPGRIPCPRGKTKKNTKTKNTEGIRSQWQGYALPVLFLCAGTVIPVVLWCCGWFALPLSGGTDWTMTAGAAAFFLGVAGYGAWKTWPEKRDKEVWVEREKRKSVCLIPCRGREEPVPISYFPYVLGNTQIVQEGTTVYVIDEESDSGTFYNDERLVPWQKTALKDGDLLRFGQGEYVVEIT